MRLFHLALAAALMLAAGAAGCSSEPKPANAGNPLDALRAETKTDRYRQSFWEDAAGNRPKLFRQAMAFCERHDYDATTYPNCEFLRGPATLYNTGRSLDSIETKEFEGLPGQ